MIFTNGIQYYSSVIADSASPTLLSSRKPDLKSYLMEQLEKVLQAQHLAESHFSLVEESDVYFVNCIPCDTMIAAGDRARETRRNRWIFWTGN
jgi:hypothetical protein